MSTYGKRLKRNIARNHLLDRELDYLPAMVDRDEVRLVARRYGPLRGRSLVWKLLAGATGTIFRYGAPFVGLIIGAELRAAKALAPLVGEEQRFGDSLRVFFGEGLAKKVDDANKVMKMTGALVSATPEIFVWALYGALWGIVCYFALTWALRLGVGYRRRKTLKKKIAELIG